MMFLNVCIMRDQSCCLTFGLDILVGNFESYDVNFLNIITNETSLLHMISPFLLYPLICTYCTF